MVKVSGTDIARQEGRALTPSEQLVALVREERFQQQIVEVLPEGVRPQRFTRAVATALLENPDLADPSKVEPSSVFQSVLKSAQDGLVPDGREAALVVFGRKAQYLPMIGGFRKIAGESGWTIRTAVVHANDEFEVELGVEPKVRHVPVRPGTDPGDPIAAYAVGAHGDGRREVEVMTVDEIEQVRAVSRAKDRGPWVEWWERMAEKTVGRRLFAKLPLGDRERVERVLAAAAMEPADAAAALYGPRARAALAPGETVDPETGEITSGAGGSDPTDAGDARGVSDDQQAGASVPESPPSPADAPVPEPEEPVLAEPEKAPTAKEITAAGKVTVPEGPNEGKTVAEIVAGGFADSDQWLQWKLATPDKWPEFHAALVLYLKAKRPDLLGSQED